MAGGLEGADRKGLATGPDAEPPGPAGAKTSSSFLKIGTSVDKENPTV